MTRLSNHQGDSKALILVGSLVYPVYTLPFVISSMLKNQRFGYLLFSFFMGYLAYLMIPYDSFDLTRHYASFNAISGYSFSEIINYDPYDKFKYPFYLYCWCVAQLGLPKEFVPFSIIFTLYSLYFLTLKKILDHTPKREKTETTKNYISLYMLTLLGVFLIFNEIRFIGAASGLRNTFAFSIFIYALFDFLYFKKRLKFIVLSILACCVHISVLPIVLIFIFSKVVKILKFNKWLLTLVYIVLITGVVSVLFTLVFKSLEPILRPLGLYSHAYMDVDGAWGLGYFIDKNIKTIILEKYLKPMPVYLAGAYFLLVKNYIRKDLARYLLIFFVFIVLVSVSRTMLDRYSILFVSLFIYFLVIELQYKPLTKVKKIFVACFIVSLLLVDVGGLYRYRGVYLPSWGKIFYTPLPITLLDSVETNEYIQRH